MRLSVIVCTYNPRDVVFTRVLNSISAALRHLNDAEFVIIDNNSELPVGQRDYVRGYMATLGGRVITEVKQGLTHARLRGIQETSGELVVFIDDDNIPDEDFFLTGLYVSSDYPFIGAWSGRVELEFEKEPPSWTKRYWGMLVHRDFTGPKWSNFPDLPESMPCGAGLFVRRDVCNKYISLHDSGQRKIVLDRTGDSLLSGGDNDLAVCACDMGMGVGLFDTLHLIHYIPESRVGLSYLSGLAEGISQSETILRYYRNRSIHQPDSVKTRVANWLRMMMMSPEDRKIYKAVLRGRGKALDMIEALEKANE